MQLTSLGLIHLKTILEFIKFEFRLFKVIKFKVSMYLGLVKRLKWLIKKITFSLISKIVLSKFKIFYLF